MSSQTMPRPPLLRLAEAGPVRRAPAMPRARQHLWIMLILAIAALGVGWALLPGEDERVAALERDGQWGRALQLLEARFNAGDRRQRTLYLMQKIYEHQGDRNKARGVLELLAAERPRDATVQRQLAQLYKQTQDEPAYVRALVKQLELRYAEPACRELIGIHRRNGAYDQEQRLIASCRALGYRRADDLVRLAFLTAADGNVKEATEILGAVDDRRWLKAGRERLLLFSNLLETEQAPEAVRRSLRWLRGAPDDDFALELVSMLINANRTDLAMRIVREAGSPGDAVALAAGEILIEQVQLGAARAFLAGWLTVAKPMSLETATRFVASGLDVDDPVLALQGADKYGLARFEQADLADLAIGLGAGGFAAELDRVRPALTADAVAADQLLAAALSIRDGRADVARLHLAQLRFDELDERRRPLFERLAERAGSPAAVAAVLREARPAAVIGPAQAKAKSILRKAATAKQRLRLKRTARPPGGAAVGTGAPAPTFLTPTPIPFPGGG